MKKIIIFIALFLVSCSQEQETFLRMYNSAIVLKKFESNSGRAGADYYITVYDGEDAEVYQCSYADYRKINTGDTFKTLILKTNTYVYQ